MGGNVPLGYNVKDSQFTFSKWIMKKGAVMPLHHHVNQQITWITQGGYDRYRYLLAAAARLDVGDGRLPLEGID